MRIMFQDEARFGRITDPKRCWAPRGCRLHVASQIVREYTYLFGAASPQDGSCDFLVLPGLNLTNMSVFLEEISKRYPNEYICMFVDGAFAHSLKSLQVPDNMVIEKIPPYSPDVNPAENIWDDMREKYFGNIVFDSMGAVEDRLVEAARHYEKDAETVQSIVGWKWIISAL